MIDDDPRPRVWLLRHGETEWSLGGRHTGRTDVPLDGEGERQALALGRRLDGHDFALVLVSPLGRARRTCELAGYGAQAQVEPDLHEVDYGDHEGLTTAQIRRQQPGWTIWSGPWPGGESMTDAGARVDRVIARVRTVGDGDVALFAHGHVLRVLAARWCGLDPADGRSLHLDTATVSVLGWEHEYPTILRWNADA
jgi:probable phosphoglycerate mutase